MRLIRIRIAGLSITGLLNFSAYDFVAVTGRTFIKKPLDEYGIKVAFSRNIHDVRAMYNAFPEKVSESYVCLLNISCVCWLQQYILYNILFTVFGFTVVKHVRLVENTSAWENAYYDVF